jgi:hypothetical protein
MDVKIMQTTAGPLLCLVDERGTIIGWIPNPVNRDVLGPGRATVYLARPQAQESHRAA